MANPDLHPDDEQALYRQLQARENQIATYRAQAVQNPRLAAAATVLHSAAPDATPGVKYAMTQAVANQVVTDISAAINAMVTAISHPAASSWADRTNEMFRRDLNPVNATKGLVRTGLGVVGSGLQGVQSLGVNTARQLNFAADPSHLAASGQGAAHPQAQIAANPDANLANLALSTTAGQMAKSLVTDHNLGDSGSGFFPGGQQEKDRAAAARAYRGTIPGTEILGPDGKPIAGSGQTATIGRVMASGMTEQGSTGYRIMSGLADGAVAWYADPGNYALEAITAARAAHSTISAVKALEDADFAKVLRPGEKFVLNKAGEEGVRRVTGTQALKNGKTRNIKEFIPKSTLADEARAARLADAGIIEGASRGTFHGPTADEFMQTRKGQAIVSSMAADSDWLSIDKALGQKVDPDVITRLAGAKDESTVREVLREVLGTSIETKRDIRKVKAPSWWDNARFNKDMPEVRLGTGYNMSALEKRQAVNNLDLTLANGKVPWEKRSQIVGDFARGMETNAQDRFGALRNAQKAMASVMVESYKVDPELAKSITTFKDTELINLYGTDALAHPTDFATISPSKVKNAQGELMLEEDLTQGIRSIGPQMLSEGLGNAASLPDPRQVRRLTSKYGWMTSTTEGKIRPSIAGMEHIQNAIWKPLAIIRPAFLTRVIGDEQMRMAASNMASAFRHPFEWISFAMHNSGSFDAMGRDFRLLEDHASDAKVWDAFNASQHRGFGRGGAKFYLDPLATEQRSYLTGGWSVAHKAQHRYQYEVGTMDEWRQIRHDPIGSRIAGGMSNDEIEAFLKHKDNKNIWNELVSRQKSQPGVDAAGNTVRISRDMNDGAQLEDYLNGIRKRIEVKAGQDPEILAALSTGRLGTGEETLANADLKVVKGGAGPIRPADAFGPASSWVGSKVKLPDGRIGMIANDAAEEGHSIVSLGANAWDHAGRSSDELKALAKRWRESEHSPPAVKYANRGKDKVPGFRGEAAAVSNEARNRVVNGFFSGLYGRASDYLSRSPAFRQFYWQRMTEMADNLSPEEANLFLRKMEEAAGKHTKSGTVRELVGSDHAVGQAIENAKNAKGSVTLEQLDEYAKGHALDKVNKLLYDASHRNNFFDITRIIFPFGEAWKEVFQSWGRIVTQNPRIINRAKVLVQGARGADPDGNGQGFFHVDPTSGQEVFTYPFSRQVSRFLTGKNPVTSVASHIPILSRFAGGGDGPGVGMDLNGSVKGLNIGMSPVPSLGLVAQIPVSMIVHDKPQLDFFKSVLLPYGETRVGASQFMPSWMAKIVSGTFDNPNTNRIYGDTYSRVVQALVASGKYGNTGDEQDRLARDAVSQARALTVFRGLVQATGPSSPAIDFEIPGKEGGAGNQMASQLIKEYQRLRAEDPSTALEEFQRLYGEVATAYTVSRTRTTQGGLDASSEFGQWEKDHESLFSSFPTVAGYMAPVGTEFDFNVYDRQLASGKREKLKAGEYLSAVNQTIVNQRYYDVKDSIVAQNGGRAMNDEQRNFLSDFKSKLLDDYPVSQAATIQESIGDTVRHLGDAVNDKRLADNPVAATVRDYLAIREAMVAQTDAAGISLANAKAAPLREALYKVGTQFKADNPLFARLWDRVLSNEVDA